jgi:hypothetical protein
MKTIMTIVAIVNIISAIFALLVSDYFFGISAAAMALAFAMAAAFDTQEA